MSLKDRLKAQIQAFGPMSLGQYMTACLHDPADGYYASRPSLGAEGDFLTAPLVSQMFGELIGLWCIAVWESLGRPARLCLVEIGPGDGTLMLDLLRALRLAPDLLAGLEIVLIEASSPLKAIQQDKLKSHTVQWVSQIGQVKTDGPVIVIANEVLDCLPARQFVRTEAGWSERLVGLGPDEALTFGLTPRPVEGLFPPAPAGSVLELSPAQDALASDVASLIATQGGAGLLIDYGRSEPGFGDTLQALGGHKKFNPLDAPGEHDLTIHADFPSVLKAAQDSGVQTGLVEQGQFLRALGIDQRAQALSLARPDQAAKLARQMERLTGEAQMGALFKVAGLWSNGLPTPPGFESDSESAA
jgi:SAM-dependent MidA family methyltransferase